MSYLSLYRKWRPGSFEDVLGQAHVTETLTAALRDDRLSHAYLFSGPRGTGKTSTARILAKALNCEAGVSPAPCGECQRCREIADGSSLDVLELDAASHTSVDDVREIRERIPYASAGGGRKVYIIDEAHQLSNPAFNALLKMLEEPPPHVVFVLCTTESHRVPATVVSRCQRFEFRRISNAVLAEHLTHVASQEDIEVDEAAVALVVRHSRGSVRDALSLLDQAAGTAAEGVRREVILEILGEAPEDVLLDLAEAISSEDVLAVFGRVEELVARGWDPRQLLVQLLEEFRALFLAHRGVPDEEVDPEHAERRGIIARRFTSAHLEWVLQALADAQADMRLSTHPRLTLEVALARASNLQVRETQTVVARLERLERALLEGARTSKPKPEPRAAQGRKEGSRQAGGEAPAEVPDTAGKQASSQQAGGEAPAEVPDTAGKQASSQQAGGEAAAGGSTGGAVSPPLRKARTQPEAPAATPEAATDLDTQWEAVLEGVRARSRVTLAHLREGWPVEARDDCLVVGFAKDFHASELIKRSDHIQRITEVLEEVFGRKMRLEADIQPGGRPEKDNPGADEPEPEQSAVDLVRRGLGAEVVEEVGTS